MKYADNKIAVLIPCYNEEKTIARVVNDFRAQLPDAGIYVFDNDSSDNTVEEAVQAGAIIGYEKKRGKGNVVRSMFSNIDADIYVMVDGDSTYPSHKVHELIEPILKENADMVIGSRLHNSVKSQFNRLNLIGNRMFLMILNLIFRVNITDLLSGYRAFNRRIAKNLPLLSKGFEIETELTIKCLTRGFKVIEIPVELLPRPVGSTSKIKIFGDGLLIFGTLFALFRDYKPLTAFGLSGLFFVVCGFIPGIIVVSEFLSTGYILRMPSAILSIGLVLSGMLIILVGLVLHTIARHFQELDIQFQNLHETVDNKLQKKNDFN